MASVVFVQNIWQEYLGVMNLSAVLKKHGHKVELLIGNEGSIYKQTKKLNPDLVGFSTMTFQHKWVSDTARFLREKGIKIPIVTGGPHATFFPDFISDPNIDILCRGEGEYALLDLVNALEHKEDISKIPNLLVKKNGKIYDNPVRPPVANLDELPYPDRELYRKYKFFRNKDLAPFMAIRGCPYRCSFCFNHKWNKLYAPHHTIRFRSVKSFIDEISQTEKKHKLNTAMIIDSTFNLDKEWILDFLKEYKDKIDVKFSINVRLNGIDDDIVKAIAETKKCAHVRFAIEVGSERLRNEVLKKGLQDKQIDDAIKLFRKYKVDIITFNMCALPTETIEEAYKTITVNQRINPTVVSCLIFMPLPGLDITNYCIQQGIVAEGDLKKLGVSPYNMHRSILKQENIGRLTNLHKFSVIAIRHPYLFPLIKQLIKLPPNMVYDSIYNISQSFEWMKWLRVGIIRYTKEAFRNYKKVS